MTSLGQTHVQLLEDCTQAFLWIRQHWLHSYKCSFLAKYANKELGMYGIDSSTVHYHDMGQTCLSVAK